MQHQNAVLKKGLPIQSPWKMTDFVRTTESGQFYRKCQSHEMVKSFGVHL